VKFYKKERNGKNEKPGNTIKRKRFGLARVHHRRGLAAAFPIGFVSVIKTPASAPLPVYSALSNFVVIRRQNFFYQV